MQYQDHIDKNCGDNCEKRCEFEEEPPYNFLK